jgi:hypothetical protein
VSGPFALLQRAARGKFKGARVVGKTTVSTLGDWREEAMVTPALRADAVHGDDMTKMKWRVTWMFTTFGATQSYKIEMPSGRDAVVKPHRGVETSPSSHVNYPNLKVALDVVFRRLAGKIDSVEVAESTAMVESWLGEKQLGLASLGIARADMPQIKDLVKFTAWLKDQGISVQRAMIPAMRLHPTQRDFNYIRTLRYSQRPVARLHLRKPVIVTSDNYVLDGHHRWLEVLQSSPGDKVNTVVIGMSVRKLLALLSHGFPGSGASQRTSEAGMSFSVPGRQPEDEDDEGVLDRIKSVFTGRKSKGAIMRGYIPKKGKRVKRNPPPLRKREKMMLADAGDRMMIRHGGVPGFSPSDFRKRAGMQEAHGKDAPHSAHVWEKVSMTKQRCSVCDKRRTVHWSVGESVLEENVAPTWDVIPYSSMRIQDVARLFDGATRASKINAATIAKIIGRLIGTLEFSVMAAVGRPEADRMSKLIRGGLQRLAQKITFKESCDIGCDRLKEMLND